MGGAFDNLWINLFWSCEVVSEVYTTVPTSSGNDREKQKWTHVVPQDAPIACEWESLASLGAPGPLLCSGYCVGPECKAAGRSVETAKRLRQGGPS